jgi:Phytanoyl-CoA dioxygenase (PhyH)
MPQLIERRQEPMLHPRGRAQEQKNRHYREKGFWVEKAVLSAGMIESVMDEMARLARAPRYRPDAFHAPVKWDGSHTVTLNRSFWPLLTCPTLLTTIRQVLDEPELVYAERSQAKVWHRCPMTGGHRDTIHERFGAGSEWDERQDPYRVVNVAFYLQPIDEGFEWGAIPGSHRHEHLMGRWERSLWRKIPRHGRIGSRLSYVEAEAGWLPVRVNQPWWPLNPPAAEIWVTPEPGDCILFDPRLVHAGGPVLGWKYAVFFSLGGPNSHTHRHATHFGPDQNVNREVYRELKQVLFDAGISLGCC